jgi:hypothetical protein
VTDDDCDDHDACTIDSCVGGTCHHDPFDCNDGNACTTQFCDPEIGCVYMLDTSLCDDGLTCTTDTCLANDDGQTFTCEHVFRESNCGVNPAPDCASFTCGVGNDCVLVFDDTRCTGGQACQQGVCTTHGCAYENTCSPDDCSPPCLDCTCAQIPNTPFFGCIGSCGV